MFVTQLITYTHYCDCIQPCRSHAATMSQPCHNHVTTLSQPCHNLVTTMSQPRHNHVTTMSQPCHNLVTTMSQPRHNHVTTSSQPCHNHVTTLSQYCSLHGYNIVCMLYMCMAYVQISQHILTHTHTSNMIIKTCTDKGTLECMYTCVHGIYVCTCTYVQFTKTHLAYSLSKTNNTRLEFSLLCHNSQRKNAANYPNLYYAFM